MFGASTGPLAHRLFKLLVREFRTDRIGPRVVIDLVIRHSVKPRRLLGRQFDRRPAQLLKIYLCHLRNISFVSNFGNLT